MSSPDTVRDEKNIVAYDPRVKQKAGDKLARIPIKVQPGEVLKSPTGFASKPAARAPGFMRSRTSCAPTSW